MASARGLVLGGGGVTGVAREIGMALGLAEAGIDLAAADVVAGTSAGSVVGAQLTSGQPLEELYEAQASPPVSEIPAAIGPGLLLRNPPRPRPPPRRSRRRPPPGRHRAPRLTPSGTHPPRSP